MLDRDALRSVALQMMSGNAVELGGSKSRVQRTSAQRLKTVRFALGGREYQAIEQNAEKPSRWGRLAREGHQVVQIKEVETNRFVAVVVDGDTMEYGAPRARRAS